MRRASPIDRTVPGPARARGGGREDARRRLTLIKRGGAVAAVAGFGVLAGLAAAHAPGARRTAAARPAGPGAARAALPARGGFFAEDGLPADAIAAEPPVVPAAPAQPPPAPVVRSSAS